MLTWPCGISRIKGVGGRGGGGTGYGRGKGERRGMEKKKETVGGVYSLWNLIGNFSNKKKLTIEEGKDTLQFVTGPAVKEIQRQHNSKVKVK